MQNDPWETKNLYYDANFASRVQDHRKLLGEWEARLDVAPKPNAGKSRKQKENDLD